MTFCGFALFLQLWPVGGGVGLKYLHPWARAKMSREFCLVFDFVFIVVWSHAQAMQRDCTHTHVYLRMRRTINVGRWCALCF